MSAPNSPFSGSLSPTSPSAGSTTINNPAGKPRFATTRQAQSTQKQPQHQRIPSYQPFVADDLDVTYHSNNSLNTNTLNATSVNGIAKNSTNSNNGSISTHPYIPSLTAKVDPAMIALPPQSPPTSTLSFSSSASRSSLSFDTLGSSGVSRASGGTAPTYSSSKVNGYSNPNSTLSGGSGGLSPHIIHPQQIVNGVNGSRRSLDGLGIRNGGRSRQSSPSSSGSLEEDGEVINLEDRRVKAEAKSNRKVSLLPPPSVSLYSSMMLPWIISHAHTHPCL